MSKSHRKRQILSLGLLATLAGTAAVQYAMAASAQPVFSPTAPTAWVGIGIGALLPVPGSPKPIGQDPAHRYISNDESAVTGEQPTQRIGDISNPNLKQWAKDVMKKDNDEVLAGKFAFTARSSCRPAGVPGFDVLLGGALFILQSPTEVAMIFSGNACILENLDLRRITPGYYELMAFPVKMMSLDAAPVRAILKDIE